MLHDADNMESISNDFGVGEIAFDQGSVGRTQVDADDTHLVPSFEAQEEGFEGLGTLALDDIEHAVALQVTESGGETAPLVEGVLVDTEDLRTVAREAFFGLARSELSIDAFVVVAVNPLAEKALSNGAPASPPCKSSAGIESKMPYRGT